MSRSDDEPFLSRWARRKRDAAHPAQADQARPAQESAPPSRPPVPDQTAPGANASTLGGETAPALPKGEEPLDLETLPKVDELTVESDITAFLDKRVPVLLRNAALSRMWSLDPTIRDFIEVAENQWNWNIPGGAPFYEEMLPGSAGNTLIADATSAISRLASETATVAETAPPLADVSEQAPAPPAPDKASASVAATQPEISPDTSVAPDQPDQRLAEREPTPPMPDAAQGHAAAQPARRRHGGALPV